MYEHQNAAAANGSELAGETEDTVPTYAEPFSPDKPHRTSDMSAYAEPDYSA